MTIRHLIVALLMLPGGIAFAEPVYQVVTDNAISCNTDASLHLAHRKPNEPLPAECERLPRGYLFEATNRVAGYTWPDDPSKSDALVYGRKIAGDNEQGTPKHLRFWRADVEAVRDEKGNFIQPNCDYPQESIVPKLLAGPDGKLYLKQGKVTIKCVNGEMRQIYQPLN